MSGLESRAARNVMIVATANKLADEWLGKQGRPQCNDRCHCQQVGQDQLGRALERERLSPDAHSR